ncbi:MAG: peptidase M14 [Alkalimonas sp.]|nr:peptidase M14 [Alkalimonas sp.]
MKWFIRLGLYLGLSIGLQAGVSAMTVEEFDVYKQPGLDKPVISFEDIQPLIEQHRQNPLFAFTKLGSSLQGTPIYQIKMGRGDTKVFAWSQMHGDEPTATAAVFDLLKYISDDAQSDWRESWMEHITLYIIPMVNPDGAAVNTRVNAQGIDINRDALALQSPEGRILMEAAKRIQPHYGFNLHDQNRFHAAGAAKNPATISLLAPAYNEARDINESRKRAMQLIAYIKPLIDEEIPNHLGRYNDAYSIRSFGDTFSSMGISTVLVESGGHRGDDNRQVARRLNFLMYVKWLDAIADGSYRNADLADHDAIPFNQRGMKDVVLSNVTLTLHNQPALVDVAFELDIYGTSGQARIDDIGDLSIFGGYHTFDAEGLHYQPGKAFELTESVQLTVDRYLALLRDGYSHFTGDAALLDNQTDLPVLLNPQRRVPAEQLVRQRSATFLLRNEQGVQYAVVNGQVINTQTAEVLYPFGT